jgi:hypothetical protein
MRIELYFIIIVVFLVVDVMNEHKYTKMIFSYKKYFKIGAIVLGGLFIYFILKKSPNHLRNIVSSANNCMKYIPIDKESKDMISPLLDLTGFNKSGSFMEHFEDVMDGNSTSSQENRILNSGGNTSSSNGNMKRSVSETKKKYVASKNDWKCVSCNNILPYYFEVDHIVALKDGGSNDVNNLSALCVNCHKKKTMADFLR